ncbi:hypothetical protein I4U23_015703 [Adineta vaga]|nr:hypothetical protein I4U23_015703 [Adineta vaga]
MFVSIYRTFRRMMSSNPASHFITLRHRPIVEENGEMSLGPLTFHHYWEWKGDDATVLICHGIATVSGIYIQLLHSNARKVGENKPVSIRLAQKNIQAIPQYYLTGEVRWTQWPPNYHNLRHPSIQIQPSPIPVIRGPLIFIPPSQSIPISIQNQTYSKPTNYPTAQHGNEGPDSAQPKKNQRNDKTNVSQHPVRYLMYSRPDAQITLYGSSLFQCCLKEANIIDIDIQFKDVLPYDTLKELLQTVSHSAHYKDARINIDHDPLAIDLSVLNSNLHFDERVLPLIRLLRILSKICNIDKPDLGTVHPIVFHFMVIYFLQQLDLPVVPCLHEHVFGVDKVPLVLNNDQYVDFFQICNAYVEQWKSKNPTNIEILFLQLLSYYTDKFSSKKFIVSIQTRMPFMKMLRHTNNKRLFCLDPTSLTRNLCYTMKANRSFQYFQHTLRMALKYFCEKQKYENDEDIPSKELIRIINKSYSLLIEHFPKENNYWNQVQQEDIRQDYKRIFDKTQEPLPEPKLELNERNLLQLLPENDEQIEESMTNEQTIISYVITFYCIVHTDAIAFSEIDDQYRDENIEEPISLQILSKDLNEDEKEILRKEYEQQVQLFNNAMLQILNNIRCSSALPIHITCDESIINSNDELNNIDDTTSTMKSPIFVYDMEAKNFDAHRGAPSVCTICYNDGHIKTECPELTLPDRINFPTNSKEWINLLSRICHQVTEQCKPTKLDRKNRQNILNYLRIEFEKSYPSCSVHAYGSSHNGFGLRQSDLDICVLLKDNPEEYNILILEKLFEIINLHSHIFKEIELVRDARVPIIRAKHSQLNIEIDISFHNIFAMENTRLLKLYSDIDPRVSQLGYMVKYLTKTCDISDAKFGTLSSYAYIIMVIHFLQQIQPPVLPVLQQLSDNESMENIVIREGNKWNVYFYDNVPNLKRVWINKNGPNSLTTGELWLEFLRYYIEQFDYEKNVVTIRQFEPLKRYEKGWFNPTIAIEDPFILTHNLADKLSLMNWTIIRRVFIRARTYFCSELRELIVQQHQYKLSWFQQYFFDVNILCPERAYYCHKFGEKSANNNNNNKKHPNPQQNVPKRNDNRNTGPTQPLMDTHSNLVVVIPNQPNRLDEHSRNINNARQVIVKNQTINRKAKK